MALAAGHKNTFFWPKHTQQHKIESYRNISSFLSYAGLHCKVKRDEIKSFFPPALQHRHESLQPLVRLTVDVLRVTPSERVRVTRPQERIDELERTGFNHVLLKVLVRAQHGNSQECVILNRIIVRKCQFKEPQLSLMLNHPQLVLVPAEQREIGQRIGAVPQDAGLAHLTEVKDCVESTQCY